MRTEIQICKKMDHPNIARVYHSWENNNIGKDFDVIFIVMEMC